MSHPSALAVLHAPSTRPPRTRLRTHAWSMDTPAFRDLCAGLALDYCKWDLYLGGTCRVLPESIVLSRETHGHLVHVTESFAAMMRRFEAGVRRDRRLMAELGIDPALFPLLEADAGETPTFSRADFFLTPDGRWVLSEFNEDVPGGFNEAAGIPALAGATVLGGDVAGDVRASLCAAFDACDTVGLVFATAFSEDLQHCSVLARWLREAGHATVHASPEQLRHHWRGPRLAGVPVQGAFRFYPAEWLRLLPNLADWRAALPRLALMNAPLRLASQSKRAFALWRAGVGITAADRQRVQDHCPHTELFDPARADVYRAQRQHWVFKQAFGRMGDAVLLGALASPQAWDDALRAALARPGEVAMQARFLIEPLPFEAGLLYPTIGVYAVNGRFAGYYSRVSAAPFTTHEASHVATVVDAA